MARTVRSRIHNKHTRRQRRGLVGNVARLGADSFDEIARGTGSIVGHVPIVGKTGKKLLNITGRTGSDLLDLAGTTGDRASGFITSPFKRLFSRKKKGHKKHNGRSQRKHKRKQKKSRKHKSKTAGVQKHKSRKHKSRKHKSLTHRQKQAKCRHLYKDVRHALGRYLACVA